MIVVMNIMGAAFLSAATVAAAPPSQDAQEEKKICKSEKITGSLTRTRRICLTQREWDRTAEIARRNVKTLDDDGNQTTREVLLAPIGGAGG